MENPLEHAGVLELRPVAAANLLVAVAVGMAVPAAHIETFAVGSVVGVTGLIEANHIRPELVVVRALRVVHHVRRVAARGPHVDLQAHHVPGLAQARLGLGEPEELQMEAAPLHPEGLEHRLARFAQVRRHLGGHIVVHRAPVVHHLHDGNRRDVAGTEENLPLAVHDAVEGADHTGHVLLQQVGRVQIGVQQPLQIRVIADGHIAYGAHAAVGLGHHGIAHGPGEGAGRGLVAVEQMPAGGGDPRLLVEGLHGALVLHGVEGFGHQAAGDVEVLPQPGVLLQPVLVVALQKVNFSVFKGEIGNRTEHLVVILHAAHPVVFAQGVPELGVKLVVGRVADAQHVYPVGAQAHTEVPVAVGEGGGDKDEIHDETSLFTLKLEKGTPKRPLLRPLGTAYLILPLYFNAGLRPEGPLALVLDWSFVVNFLALAFFLPVLTLMLKLTLPFFTGA